VDLNRIIQDLKAERDVLAATVECLEQSGCRSSEEARTATGMDETPTAK
jgi:hypothetical protein